ncbi:MAG: DUF5376 family protein, partial [Leptotrichiaceae bacterium]|nr:DUF5376 family protein [Leptotrichiaceae bacterium]
IWRENMRLTLKFKYEEDKFIRVCEPFSMPYNNTIKKMDYKEYMDYILENNILDEVYLADYIDSSDIDLTKYILDKLIDKTLNDYDIGSQSWDVELENDKVIISQMYSSEDDKKAYIDRKEVVYAMLKWKNFLEGKFDNLDYEEIIDTEDVYKK